MNAQSSRSHAIFTLQIAQQRPIKTLVQWKKTKNCCDKISHTEIVFLFNDFQVIMYTLPLHCSCHHRLVKVARKEQREGEGEGEGRVSMRYPIGRV